MTTSHYNSLIYESKKELRKHIYIKGVRHLKKCHICKNHNMIAIFANMTINCHPLLFFYSKLFVLVGTFFPKENECN